MPTTHTAPQDLGASARASSARSTWMLFSALGMAVGAALAIWVFPESAAGMNPVGYYGMHVIGFAAFVGAGFGLAQAVTLGVILSRRRPELPTARRTGLCLAWLGASLIGVPLMLLPLWGVDIMEILFMPLTAPILMLPGLAVLAATQWVVLAPFGVPMGRWMLRTLVGGLVGVVLGLLGWMGLGVVGLPLEVVGLGCVGLAVGWAQGYLVAAALR